MTREQKFYPTGKAIADYVRKDRGHLADELRAVCRSPMKTREHALRQIAWAAVDNIEYAMEGRYTPPARGEITDAVKRLQSYCVRKARR